MDYKEISTFIVNNYKQIQIITIMKENYKLERKSIGILLELIENDLIQYSNYEITYNFMEFVYFDIKYNYEWYYNELYVNKSLNNIINKLDKIYDKIYKEYLENNDRELLKW